MFNRFEKSLLLLSFTDGAERGYIWANEHRKLLLASIVENQLTWTHKAEETYQDNRVTYPEITSDDVLDAWGRGFEQGYIRGMTE